MEEIYFVDNNKLLKKNNVIIEVTTSIISFMLFKNKIILHIEPKDELCDRNIFCYNLNGKLEWIVQSTPRIHDKNYFMKIYSNTDNELMAYSLNGIEVTIDLNTGIIIKQELIK
jgi:hypothetical protein